MALDDFARARIATVLSEADLDERQRRVYLGAEAISAGHGGVAAVARASGCSESTVRAGVREVREGARAASEAPASRKHGRKGKGRGKAKGKSKARGKGGRRAGRKGGGRKRVDQTCPEARRVVAEIVDSTTYGDPMREVAYTTKSVRDVAREASSGLGRRVSHETVRKVLRSMGHSLKGNKKCLQVGESHPDRDGQITRIGDRIKWYASQGLPVVSVDCKKKELVGNFANVGRERSAKGRPVGTYDHDLPIKGLGKAAPYGVYDVVADEAWVSVGVSADTAEFAVSSLQSWWDEMGRPRYGECGRLLVTCGGGGSNGVRCRLWKLELQRFADRNRIQVEVCHYTPGNSKFDKIERRLFSEITKHWRAVPLTSLELMRDLIASTTTGSGLRVRCGIDHRTYQRGIKVTDEEMSSLAIVRDDTFHPEWNYLVRARPTLELAAA